MSSTNTEIERWAQRVRAEMGAGLRRLELHDPAVQPGGRVRGFHAVVRASAPVTPELGLDAFGETTALFELAEMQGGELMRASLVEGRLAELCAAVPESSPDAFGAHLLRERPWIDDAGAVPTLGASGRVGIVAAPAITDDGEAAPRFFLRVTTASDRLAEQADAHLVFAARAGATYGELLARTEDTWQGTTSAQVYGAGAKLMRRAAVAAAERVGAALGLEFAEMAFDNLLTRERPTPCVVNTTNVLRAGPDGTVEIFSGTIPVAGPFVYDFGGVASLALVEGCPHAVASVAAAPGAPTIGAPVGREALKIDATFTWEGKTAGVGSPVLATAAPFKERFAAAKKTWRAAKVDVLFNKLVKAPAASPLDAPLSG